MLGHACMLEHHSLSRECPSDKLLFSLQESSQASSPSGSCLNLSGWIKGLWSYMSTSSLGSLSEHLSHTVIWTYLSALGLVYAPLQGEGYVLLCSVFPVPRIMIETHLIKCEWMNEWMSTSMKKRTPHHLYLTLVIASPDWCFSDLFLGTRKNKLHWNVLHNGSPPWTTIRNVTR